MEKDYSEYVLSEAEKYRLRRRGNQDLSLDYFNNTVRFVPESRTFYISVDPYKEDAFFHERIKEFEETDAAHREIHPDDLTPEDEADYEQERLDDLAENEEDFAELCARYTINRAFYDERINGFYERHTDEKRAPLNNVLSGADITLRYGEGILDFIYADFLPAAQYAISFSLFEKTFAEMLSEKGPNMDATGLPDDPEKIYDSNWEAVEEYFKYRFTLFYTKELSYRALYTAICPPVFEKESVTEKALERYYDYLLTLQREYRELIEFCFDEKFFPEVLGHLCAAERYYLYRKLHDLPTSSHRTERMFFDLRNMSDSKMPYGMTMTELVRRISSTHEPTGQFMSFAEQYDIKAEKLSPLLQFPCFLNIGYEFSTVADILELEFTKLLEQNVRFRKCKRCGRYFIMKGNYDTRYCNRISDGETRSCQDLAAQENYERKNADNKAVPIYSKYYKRYAARGRVKQIKEADFKHWKYQAITKRDECAGGKLTVEELTAWMEASFPNREKKK